MFENLTDKHFDLMDKVFTSEYINKGKGMNAYQMAKQFNASIEDITYAERNIRLYIENYGSQVCRINVYNSGRYSYIKFFPHESEMLIKKGFKRTIQGLSKTEKWYWNSFTKGLYELV